jgi:flagellar hook-associated protein 2
MSISLNLNNFTGGSSSSGLGTGQGIDVTAVVDQIIASESAPETLMQKQLSSLQLQATALNTLNSSMAALQTAVNAMRDSFGAISGKVASSSFTDLLSASADATTQAGLHNVVITNLASGSSYASAALPENNQQFTAGSFTLQVGSGTPVTITVASGQNILDALAAQINQQQIGVSASVIHDVSGARLALISQKTGSASNLTITGNTTGLTFNKTATGADANLVVDGITVTSASNTVASVIPGVTLNLLSAAPGTPIALTIAPDRDGAATAINNFVSAYNAVVTAINKQYAVDSTTHNQGVLAGNSDLRRLQASLLGDVTYAMTGNNGINSLASIGVKMNNDGTLTVDSTALGGTLQGHYTDFQNFLQTATTGYAQRFASDLMVLNDPTQGPLSLSLAENRNTQGDVNRSISDFEDRLLQRRQTLTKQYSQIDTMLRLYPLQIQQIQSQLSALSSSK